MGLELTTYCLQGNRSAIELKKHVYIFSSPVSETPPPLFPVGVSLKMRLSNVNITYTLANTRLSRLFGIKNETDITCVNTNLKKRLTNGCEILYIHIYEDPPLFPPPPGRGVYLQLALSLPHYTPRAAGDYRPSAPPRRGYLIATVCCRSPHLPVSLQQCTSINTV